jgi:hypothetical protein
MTMFVDAVKDQPGLFIAYSAEFVSLGEHDEHRRFQFEVAKLRFYEHLVNRGDMEGTELQEAIGEAIAQFGRTRVRDELTKR